MGKGIDLNAHIVENNTERDALDHENGDEQVQVRCVLVISVTV